MIGNREFNRFLDIANGNHDPMGALEAWGIEHEAFASLVDQYAREASGRVSPLGPLGAYEAICVALTTGFEIGFMARLEAELQDQVR